MAMLIITRGYVFFFAVPLSPAPDRGLRGTTEAAAVGGRGGALGGRSAGGAAKAGAAADGAGGEWDGWRKDIPSGYAKIAIENGHL